MNPAYNPNRDSTDPVVKPSPSNPSSGRVLYIEGIRGLAALFIVLAHHWHLTGRPKLWLGPIEWTNALAWSFAGIDTFVVLSGFALTFSWWRMGKLKNEFPSLWPWFANRFWRLAPSYYAVLLVFGLPMLPIVARSVGWDQTLQSLLVHFAFLQAYFSDGLDHFCLPAWSLTTDWQRFLLLPILFLFLRRWSIKWVFAAMLTCEVIYRFSLWQWHDLFIEADYRIQSTTIYHAPGRLGLFGLGIVAARLVATGYLVSLPETKRRVFHCVTLLLLLGMGLSCHYLGRTFPLTDLICGLAISSSLVSLSAVTGGIRAVLSHKTLVFLGTISYSLYLTHWPIDRFLNVKVYFNPSKPFSDDVVTLVMWLYVPMALLFAWGWYRVFEVTFPRWRKQRFGRVPHKV